MRNDGGRERGREGGKEEVSDSIHNSNEVVTPVLEDPVWSTVGVSRSVAHDNHLMSQLTVVRAAHVVIVDPTAVELERGRETRPSLCIMHSRVYT